MRFISIREMRKNSAKVWREHLLYIRRSEKY